MNKGWKCIETIHANSWWWFGRRPNKVTAMRVVMVVVVVLKKNVKSRRQWTEVCFIVGCFCSHQKISTLPSPLGIRTRHWSVQEDHVKKIILPHSRFEHIYSLFFVENILTNRLYCLYANNDLTPFFAPLFVVVVLPCFFCFFSPSPPSPPVVDDDDNNDDNNDDTNDSKEHHQTYTDR